jgi:hypothetical protein
MTSSIKQQARYLQLNLVSAERTWPITQRTTSTPERYNTFDAARKGDAGSAQKETSRKVHRFADKAYQQAYQRVSVRQLDLGQRRVHLQQCRQKPANIETVDRFNRVPVQLTGSQVHS